MRRPAPLLVTLSLLLAATPLGAQQPSLRPRPSSLFQRSPAVPATTDTLNLPKTHAMEGALIGGGLGLLLGAAAGRGICAAGEDCTSSTIGGALTGLMVFGITGALIGGAIEKPVP